VVPRQRRHQQDGGLIQCADIAVAQVFLEVDQAAEGLGDHHIFDDADFFVANGNAINLKRRFFVILAQAVHQLVPGGDPLGKRRMSQRRDGIAEQFRRRIGPLHQGR